tara:strand:- start:19 stop:372 length:354 start_codon:yes stop_codon:yes gene_type:complete
MKLTEKQIAEVNQSSVDEYGNKIQSAIPKSFVERASGGVVSTSTWKDQNAGYVEVYITIYPQEFGTKAKRVQFHRENPDKVARSIYQEQASGRTVAEAKRNVFLQAIKHFTSKEVAA